MRQHRVYLLGAAVLVAALIVTAARAGSAIAQTANSNAGLQGGQDGLFDAILATPNQKTPVPQDNIFATAPGVEQAARTPQAPRWNNPAIDFVAGLERNWSNISGREYTQWRVGLVFKTGWRC